MNWRTNKRAGESYIIEPPSRFRHWVESFFVYRGAAPRLILPTCAFDVVIAAGAEPEPAPAFIHGFLSTAFSPPPTMVLDAVGIRFRPGGFRMLLGISPTDASDGIHPLGMFTKETIFQRNLRRTFAHKDLQQRIRGLEDLLDDFVRPAPLSSSATAVVCEAMSKITHVHQLAQATRLSVRQVERIMSEQVGVTPKKFLQIRRFRRAVRRRAAGLSWSEAAIAAGYYDQPHLTKDCRTIAGVTPKELERMASEGMTYRV
ncbi:MAG TPA: helix-turn-helix domain-containing protein [Thermoanaerobaculia bacterium]|nr:helix-turn-helix domain-containing protein [Thermoanaerobaculia bacterium]